MVSRKSKRWAAALLLLAMAQGLAQAQTTSAIPEGPDMSMSERVAPLAGLMQFNPVRPSQYIAMLPGRWAKMPLDRLDDKTILNSCQYFATTVAPSVSGMPSFEVFQDGGGPSNPRQLKQRLEWNGYADFSLFSSVPDLIDFYQDPVNAGNIDENATAARYAVSARQAQRYYRVGVIARDVIFFLDKQRAGDSRIWVRCPSADARNMPDSFASIRDLLRETARNFQRQQLLGARNEKGTVPLIEALKGEWTLLSARDQRSRNLPTVRAQCLLRRVEMRADHGSLPVLSSHVLDQTPPISRKALPSDDEFDIRFLADQEFIHVNRHDPLEKDKFLLTLWNAVDPAPDPSATPLTGGTVYASPLYHDLMTRSISRSQFIEIDPDTFLESVTQGLDAPDSVMVPLNYWFRCPAGSAKPPGP